MNEKMSYDDFKNAVVGEIRDFLPPSYKDWKISLKTMYKVNFAQDGLMVIPPEEDTKNEIWRTPTMYLKGYYEKFQSGENFNEIMKQITATVTKYTKPYKIERNFLTRTKR